MKLRSARCTLAGGGCERARPAALDVERAEGYGCSAPLDSCWQAVQEGLENR
jgi:hypothetical protein